MARKLLLLITHVAALAAGFALGIYLLPILVAPPGPAASEVQAVANTASYRTRFQKGLKGSDALHWGEGDVFVGPSSVALKGSLAPGPAYRLYLTPKFVETKEDFLAVKAQSRAVGDVKTFDGFVLPLAAGTPLDRFEAVVVWCEAFSMFITAGKYR